MQTLETDVEIGADGNMKLLSPLPEWLKAGRKHVLISVVTVDDQPRRQKLVASSEMVDRRTAALEKIRELDPYRDVKNPVEWQREIRSEHPVVGRD